jgi:hypothetical protein
VGVRALPLSFLISNGGEGSSLITGAASGFGATMDSAMVLTRFGRGELGREGGMCWFSPAAESVVELGGVCGLVILEESHCRKVLLIRSEMSMLSSTRSMGGQYGFQQHATRPPYDF